MNGAVLEAGMPTAPERKLLAGHGRAPSEAAGTYAPAIPASPYQ